MAVPTSSTKVLVQTSHEWIEVNIEKAVGRLRDDVLGSYSRHLFYAPKYHPSGSEAGQPCPRAGYWFTPAQIGSRRFFKAGDVMPEVGGDYGATVWQWDREAPQAVLASALSFLAAWPGRATR